MPFDIHDPLVDEEGYVDDVAVERYQRQLQRLFSASPEACEIRRMGLRLEWTELMLEFALNDLQVTPPQMDDDDLLAILLEYFPGKTPMTEDDIGTVLLELRAFWQFVQREYRLRNARGCLRVLNRRTAGRMVRAVGGADFELDEAPLARGRDDDDEELELPRWLEFVLETSFRLWTRLRKRLGKQS
jgi:hypothetical protein